MKILDSYLDEEQQRFLLFLGVPVLLVIAVVTTILLWPDKPEETTGLDTSISFSSEDQRSAEAFTEEFVREAGDFGQTGEVTENNIANYRYLLKTGAGGTTDFYNDRENDYLSYRDKIVDGAPLAYSVDTISRWESLVELDELWSYTPERISAQASEKGTQVHLNGQPMDALEVTVTYDSTIKRYAQAQTDVSWQGDYLVQTRTYPGVTATFVLVKDNGEWRAFDKTVNAYDFTLSTWKDVKNTGYPNDIGAFDSIGTIYDTSVVEAIERAQNASAGPSASATPSATPTGEPTNG